MSFFPLFSGSSREQAVTATSDSITIRLKNRLIIVTGGTPTITLPSADITGLDSNYGLFFTVATWGGTATLAAAGADRIKIDATSVASKSIAAYSSITVTVGDSSGWIVVATSGTIT
tara:strand:- start:520 stop:870 length:351 start_codon:yes stop_codon:yes gene_type:complete